jgi:hypothetical protein
MDDKFTYHLFLVLVNAECDLSGREKALALGRGGRSGFVWGGDLVDLSVKSSQGHSHPGTIHLPSSSSEKHSKHPLGRWLLLWHC